MHRRPAPEKPLSPIAAALWLRQGNATEAIMSRISRDIDNTLATRFWRGPGSCFSRTDLDLYMIFRDAVRCLLHELTITFFSRAPRWKVTVARLRTEAIWASQLSASCATLPVRGVSANCSSSWQRIVALGNEKHCQPVVVAFSSARVGRSEFRTRPQDTVID